MVHAHRWLLTRDFSFMWWSQVLSQVAEGISKLALLWFVYAVAGSPLKTTVIGLLQTLPPILFGPFIGVIVDRFPKKVILIGSDVARGVLIGLIPCLVSIENFTVEALYVLTFLFGVATAVFVPALSSAVPFMVARPQFTAANALLQSTTSLGIIIGPAVSGIGIAFSGSQDVLCLNALTYFASAACLLPIRLRTTEQMNRNLVSGVNLCTNYVVFDATQPPFDVVNVRKAFSMAFDRQRYIDVLYQGLVLPAVGLYPPGLPGFDYSLEGLQFDPEQARELLKQSKYGGPEGLPPIVFTASGIGSYVSGDIAAMAQMWKQNLGVTITVENLESNFYYDQIYADNHGQLLDGGWCADYPDPENIADVLFHTGSAQSNGGYSNAQLDTLLEAARIESDVTRRIGMYQQAEQMLVDDAAALFTIHYLSYELVKPYVKGYVLTPIDIPIERYMWLEGK